MLSLPNSATNRIVRNSPVTALKTESSCDRRSDSVNGTPQRRSPVPLVIVALAAATSLSLFVYATSSYRWFWPNSIESSLLTVTVIRSTVPVTVTAGGELESAEAIDVMCQLEGQEHKIIEMLPEGTHVIEGQVVIRLDPSAINDRLAQQQIKVTQAEAVAKAAAEELKIKSNLSASQIAQADLAVQLAELDKRKYLEGEYQAELSDLQGKIALAKAGLQDAEDTREYYRDLVKKGFRTPEQMRAKEQEVQRAQFELQGHEKRLEVLEQFTRVRQETELAAKADESKRELDRAKSSAAATIARAESDLAVAEATLRLEREQLDRIKQQLVFSEVTAVAEGTLVYAKEQNKKIEIGGVVHYKQKLFSVPNMSRMQMQAFVHESEIKKLKPGMPAEIRVDALPNQVMTGHLKDVASFYDATRHWLSGGVKEYTAIVTIEGTVDESLKPGMTSQVAIRVGELRDALLVPITSVAEREGQYYCFAVEDNQIRPRQVTVGAFTENLVEVRKGLREGEQVTLDARRRLEGLSAGDRRRLLGLGPPARGDVAVK